MIIAMDLYNFFYWLITIFLLVVIFFIFYFDFVKRKEIKIRKPRKSLNEIEEELIEKDDVLTDEQRKKMEDQLLEALRREKRELWIDLEKKTIKQLLDMIEYLKEKRPPQWIRIIKFIKIYLKRKRNYIIEE